MSRLSIESMLHGSVRTDSLSFRSDCIRFLPLGVGGGT